MDPFSQPFVAGRHRVEGVEVPRVGTTLVPRDRLGAIKVRWGIGRYNYLVVPGLYAVGAPNKTSPVLATANYKLTFDTLRSHMAGIDAFVLVLETMGINVWCAAGKGTFGTEELCHRIADVDLGNLVDHRRIIVPQLGAPGVAAHLVKSRTGFSVRYGPIEARDLKQYFADGNKATGPMRTKRFPLSERLDLVPMELVPALKYAVPTALVLAAAGAALGSGSDFVEALLRHGLPAGVAVLLGVFCGAVLTPVLLPFLPGKPFAVKGTIAAVFLGFPAVVGAFALADSLGVLASLHLAGLAILAMAISSFLAMNFTGASTYTSLSGVEKEMKYAVPAQAISAILGLAVWGIALALGGGS